jgi:hypothetical protein
MGLTRAQIRTLARPLANDTDSANPFLSDTNVNLLIENWQSDLASYLRYPRATSSPITMVQDQDDYDLPTDWLSTIRIFIYTGSTYTARLQYKSEDEISEVDPNWRNAISGSPRYYFIANDITPAATLSRKLIIYPAPDSANVKTMLHVYVKRPTAISDDAHVPIFPDPMHMLAVYYLAWFMNLPLRPAEAEKYRILYVKERLRMCGEARKETEQSHIIVFK